MKHDLKFEGTNIKMIKTESDYQAALKRLETIAELFDVNVPAKSKHLNFFFGSGELQYRTRYNRAPAMVYLDYIQFKKDPIFPNI